MLIEKYEGVRANWAPDIIGRAYGNRGDRHWLYTSVCPGPDCVSKGCLKHLALAPGQH